ncbi:hypothetical protein BJ508DRAFT_411727 [Ascobolus immersus RN42]|uniref:Uncharacterized protein n=1 Tax=Ascobolus immersus RN42 TaxID=1160509 RepID=A0A3N4IIR8_ASCIM|nr:hypothetical protein BJ508DRAFT_411727 [Ascobolus immersus RN42]
MVAGRKGFDRLKWSFDNKFPEPLQFIFCDLEQFKQTTGQHTDCPVLQALNAKEHIVKEDIFTTPKLKIPKFIPPYAGPQAGPTHEREDWADWTLDLLEYLGLASIPADRLLHGDKTDTFLSRYDFEVLEIAKPGKLTRIRWRGMIPPQWLKTVWETARTAVESSTKDSNWAAFTVLGFEDAPISWNVAQHSAVGGAEGEHGYTLIVTPSTEESFSAEPHLSADKMEVDERRTKAGPVISCEFMGPYDEHS